jgi:hypothetical protein
MHHYPDAGVKFCAGALLKRIVKGERGGAKSDKHYVENVIFEILIGSKERWSIKLSPPV